MEKLYIQVHNNNVHDHPAFEKNLLEAFGQVPANWEPFVRVPVANLGTYQVLVDDQSTYAKVDGVWTDVWHIREMTAEEKSNKQQQVKDAWVNQPNADNFAAWTFDEETCAYQPPIPKPDQDKNYVWRGSDNSWVELPEYPQDGKKYIFDLTTAQWQEHVS